jgi:hypothetical protein
MGMLRVSNGNLTDGERLIKMETEMSSIRDTVFELKTMLTELAKRDEKYVSKNEGIRKKS